MAPQVPTGRVLELSLISAQDLAPVSKSMRTYAVAWVRPERKLTTRVDENGQANPSWNEKFVFRIDDHDLKSDNSEVTIEIYALTWLRVVLTGIVRAHLSDLIPPSARRLNKNVTATRFFTLQVARPSGRPQGTINIGVSLVNTPLRSMPLQSEVSATTYAVTEVMVKENKGKNIPEKNLPINGGNNNKKLQRSHSERTDDRFYAYYPPAGSVYNESMVNGSQVGGGRPGGSVVGMGSLVSSIGPSASIVAEAIARGLYPKRANAYQDDGRSSIIMERMAESESAEGLKTKIERWRTELPPLYDRKNGKPNPKGGARGGKVRRRRHSDGGSGSGLFSCFGNAYGCEFSISCGGCVGGVSGGHRKKHK